VAAVPVDPGAAVSDIEAPMEMPNADPPSKDEILRAIDDVEAEVAAFFGGLSETELVHREGDAWTPAEHLAHLATSVSAVARGLGMPRLLLRLRFGRAWAPSRSYSELRRDYQERLAAGGRASGAFVPPREDPGPAEVAPLRAALLARWGRVNGRLRAALAPWSERQLDRIRLPHPLLGELTTREMLFFTLYHGRHHVESAARRLPRA
jgi:hypothetical protein